MLICMNSSFAFWSAVEASDTPLEILAHYFRIAHLYEDYSSRDRIFTIIIKRIHGNNEYWAKTALRTLDVSEDERRIMVGDLCADVYECLLRALLDDNRGFWEVHFLHCLRLERKHVYKAFMMREGYWNDRHVKRSNRIPRAVVVRLDTSYQHDEYNNSKCSLDIEDEKAQKQLQSIEQKELLEMIQCLPAKLKTVVLLLYWEGLSEKEVATLLSITDRTVRNRIKQALDVLQTILSESEYIYGTKARNG